MNMENQIFENKKIAMSDEELVAMFFAENRQEVEDNGFSRRVMKQLPNKSIRLGRIWMVFCTIVGIAFFFLADGLGQLKMLFGNLLGNLEGFLISADFSIFSSPIILLGVVSLLMTFVLSNLLLSTR